MDAANLIRPVSLPITYGKRMSWYKARRYLHFDHPLGLKKATNLASDPACVTQHAFLPFLRVELKARQYKKDDTGKRKMITKKRAVMYAAHADAQIFAYYADLLQHAYERRLEELEIADAPIAYRRLEGRCNIHFANEAFDTISRVLNGVAIAADVSKFFEKLNHRKLKQSWARILGLNSLPSDHFAVWKAITRYAYVELDKLHEALGISKRSLRSKKGRYCTASEFRSKVRNGGYIERNRDKFGIPQGSPISAVLSNLYMLDFDLKIHKLAVERGAYYRRYSDDILIVCQKADKDHFLSALEHAIKEVDLILNDQKLQISNFDFNGEDLHVVPRLQYLGFEFDGKHKMLRGSTLARHKNKAFRAIRRARNSAEKRGVTRIWRKKVYSLFSHLPNRSYSNAGRYGKRNFYDYVRISTRVLDDDKPRRQMRKHWPWLNKTLNNHEDEIERNHKTYCQLRKLLEEMQ